MFHFFKHARTSAARMSSLDYASTALFFSISPAMIGLLHLYVSSSEKKREDILAKKVAEDPTLQIVMHQVPVSLKYPWLVATYKSLSEKQTKNLDDETRLYSVSPKP